MTLKPCPCCGAVPKFEIESESGHGGRLDNYFVGCVCGLRTKSFLHYADKIEDAIWNRRDPR